MKQKEMSCTAVTKANMKAKAKRTSDNSHTLNPYFSELDRRFGQMIPSHFESVTEIY